MAQLRVTYTIPAITIPGSGTFNGSQVDVTFTYDATSPINGTTDQFLATAASGTYSPLDSSGNVIRTDNITNILPVGSFGNNNNVLYLGNLQDNPPVPPFDGRGVTYKINNNADGNDQNGSVNTIRQGDFIQEGGGNGNNSTTYTAAVVCFVTGTLIRTTRGDVAVEHLKVGDLAVTASGEQRPIRWIGHRDLEGGANPLPHDQQPVRVRAGAFGPGLPARDLYLSPGHPVLVGADEMNEGGVLVPIMCLINGTSIVRESRQQVTYWHVELDSHDILLAEGLPAESYLDWGDRPFFVEASEHALHNPDFVEPGLAGRCRPVAVDGPLVEAARIRLAATFATTVSAQCGWHNAERYPWLAA